MQHLYFIPEWAETHLAFKNTCLVSYMFIYDHTVKIEKVTCALLMIEIFHSETSNTS